VSAFPCPHCGGEVVVLPGTSPFPDWEGRANLGANVGANPLQSPAAIADARKILGSGSKTSAPKSRTYNQGYDPAFLEFWDVYPRKRNKRAALLAYRRANRRANADAILEGAERYRDDPNREDEFTQHPSTWLNGDGWEDEPLPARIDRTRPPDPPRPMTSGAMKEWAEIESLRDG
jgi:hypothetical protein